MSVETWKDISIWLQFHQSKIHDLGVVEQVARLLASRGFLPADGVIPNIKPVDDIGRLVHEHLIDYSHDPVGLKIMKKLWTVPFPLVLTNMPDLIAHLDFAYIDSQRSNLIVGGLVDFEFKDQRHYVEPFAQQLKELGLVLYPLVQPMLGWVDESFSNETDTKDSLKLKLRTISWVNFFSPAYVQKYGQAFLLGLPGYKTELLPDGGVFHQLSPTFVAPSEQEAQRLRRWVIGYCAEHGLKVTCRAPYVIPGLTLQPESKGPVSDVEVQEYLQHALAVTLVLTDGTRVKPIYIPWADLTPKQRQMALEAIREAAIAEIQRPGRKRIRFEFNAIPDELDRLLAELAGRDNPDFEWVEVAMEP